MKSAGKEDIIGVRPVAPFRARRLPFAKPIKIEVDLPQAKHLKREGNRLLNRINFPEPRKMIFNRPEPELKQLLRNSWKARQGPTPAEVFDLKVGAAIEEEETLIMETEELNNDNLEDFADDSAYDYEPPDE